MWGMTTIGGVVAFDLMRANFHTFSGSPIGASDVAIQRVTEDFVCEYLKMFKEFQHQSKGNE